MEEILKAMPDTAYVAPVNLEEVQLHTEEMQDIITAPPAWLIRWGISIFLLVLLAIFSTSIFIKYPDIVKAPLVISSTTASKSITAGSTGRVINILVKPNQPVKSGQIIAYIENNADHQQVLTMLADLSIIKNDLFSGKALSDNLFNNINVNLLGELQPFYESFYLEYEANQSAIKTQRWDKLSYFIQNLDKLMSETLEWKRKYVLSATQTGNIQFNQVFHPYQMVNAGQELFYIPSGTNNYFGEIMIPQANINKIKVGQQVVIKVNHLPYEKYGNIEGTITSISDLPLNNGNYELQVHFLKSSRGLLNSSNLRAGMLCNAEIITDNVTLFNRLTNGLLKKTADK